MIFSLMKMGLEIASKNFKVRLDAMWKTQQLAQMLKKFMADCIPFHKHVDKELVIDKYKNYN